MASHGVADDPSQERLQYQKKLFMLRQQTKSEKREMELVYEKEQMQPQVVEDDTAEQDFKEIDKFKQTKSKIEAWEFNDG